MVPEHDPMLMEALMLFSSEDSDDSSACTEVEQDRDEFKQRERSAPQTYSARTSTFDPAHRPSASVEFNHRGYFIERNSRNTKRPRGTTARQYGEALSQTSQSTESGAILRRKKSKKCTYAARRAEVDSLRTVTARLRAELDHLQQRIHFRDQARRQAEYERDLLAQSQAEQSRLKALVAATEIQIRQAQQHHHI